MNEKLLKRFEELVVQVEAVQQTKHVEFRGRSGTPVECLDGSDLVNWRVKAKTLLERACGVNSAHYKHFEQQEGFGHLNNVELCKRLKAIFLAAKEDFEGGHLTSMRSLVRAEVFDVELEQADELLKNGYVTAAAVIAGVVLETNMRDVCIARGIPVGSLNRMNDDLAKAGAYSALVQKQIVSLAAIRNSAAHGNQQAYSEADVEEMLRSLRRLITNYFL